MDDPKAIIDRALRADPEAINALVAHLCPPIQRQINAAILSRGLVPRLARQSVLDMTQNVLTAVFANQGASFQSWDPQMPLQTWVAYIGDAHAAAALNQICPPPQSPPAPADIDAWWQAVASQDGAQLPVPAEQVEHALIMLRPMMQHEHQALSAAQSQFMLQSQATGPAQHSKPSTPERKSIFPLDAKQKRGVYVSAGMTVVLLTGMAADRITSDPVDDLVPSFTVQGRQGKGLKPPVYAHGERIEVRLRPVEPIDPWAVNQKGDPILLSVEALAQATKGEVVNWNYELTRSETGDFVLTGEVGKNLPVTPGEWELFLVVGPREDLDLLNSQAITDVEPPPPPFERVRYKFMVRTSTSAP